MEAFPVTISILVLNWSRNEENWLLGNMKQSNLQNTPRRSCKERRNKDPVDVSSYFYGVRLSSYNHRISCVYITSNYQFLNIFYHIEV
ncbi:hypothetical protein GDO78_001972 [Eleutherodactylus coqui]|uniref:Uncharacterized protein n=1 Tax=Eleutherodactylus coqui TaxID=57060 RepID=A0A8J6KP90_ELECQ|nr:hypothetical protein GDO78_001972 [Eleutherodactylus coqui]